MTSRWREVVSHNSVTLSGYYCNFTTLYNNKHARVGSTEMCTEEQGKVERKSIRKGECGVQEDGQVSRALTV